MKKKLLVISAVSVVALSFAGAWVWAQQHPRAGQPNGVTSGVDTKLLRATIEGDTVRAEEYTFKIVPFVDGLSEPWGIAFLGDGRALVTEKGGSVKLVEQGKVIATIQGTPETRSHGQGGMMAVAVDPDFDKEPWVYLGYTHFIDKRQMTRIVRGKIDSQNRWTDEQLLFEAKPDHYRNAGVHFGVRIVFDNVGHLYFAIGDRGSQNNAQDINLPNGKTFRINRDGSIPKTTPSSASPARTRPSGPTATATRRDWPSTRRPTSSGPPSTAPAAATNSTS
jgi:glucose/arabinose dehydrogenase